MSIQGPGQQPDPEERRWNVPPPTMPPISGVAPPPGTPAPQPPFAGVAPPPTVRPQAALIPVSDGGLLVRRLFARMLDGLFLMPITVGLMFWYSWDDYSLYFEELSEFTANGSVGRSPEPPIGLLSGLPIAYYMAVAAAMFLWAFLGYYLLGATLGKKILSVKVVDESGNAIAGEAATSFKRAAVEFVMLIPLIGPLLSIANLVLVLMRGNRSIYDRVAWTRVVRN